MKRGVLALALALVVLAGSAVAQPDSDKAHARQLFEQGMALARDNKWQAALAAFLRSREIYGTPGNTQNAAVALSRVGRHDEAYDMFAALLREFPDLPESERRLVEEELGKLVRLVGTLEVTSTHAGASVSVDGRVRGTIPLAGSLRVTAGAHLLRVFKPGFVPYVEPIDVVGGETTQRVVRLQALRRSGVLSVVEATGKPAAVYVDGAPVGRTPWQGRLDPGRHAVALRGAADLGTQPVSASVRAEETVTLSLVLEPLACSLRVTPTPVGASVAIDGVDVGRGVWQGPLRCGAHRVEAGEEGFVAKARSVQLTRGRQEALAMNLERDPRSPRWQLVKPPRFELGASLGAALGVTLGGPKSTGCDSECDRSFALGAVALARGGYAFASGLGLGIEIGGLRVRQSVDGSRVEVGDGSNGGGLDARVNDVTRLDALLLGADVFLERGDDWAWRAELAAGVALARVDAYRDGTLLDGAESLDPIRETADGQYLYAAPEVGVARRFGSHFELGVGLRGLFLFALSRPRFDEDRSDPPRATAGGTATRFVRYGDAHTERVVFLLSPQVFASYSFF